MIDAAESVGNGCVTLVYQGLSIRFSHWAILSLLIQYFMFSFLFALQQH